MSDVELGMDPRDRFGDVLDGTLSETEREAFERALAADAELREDFEAYRAVVRGVSDASPKVRGADATAEVADAAADGAQAVEAPDLVPRVQAKIRKRSRGKFFRDRFAQSGPAAPTTLLVAITGLLVLALAWVLLQNVELVVGR